MHRMLLAERAVLLQLKTLRIVLLVFHTVVVPALALGAFESYLRSVDCSHFPKNSMQKNHTKIRCVFKVYHKKEKLSTDF